MRSATSAALGCLLAAAFYMVLIDTVDLPEIYAAVAAVLLAGVAYQAGRRQRVAEAAIAPGWLARAPRVVLSVPRQIGWLAGQAFAQLIHPRPVRGRFRAVAFDAGGATSRDAGRRALAEGLGSLAPNTIVLGIDAETDLLLVHQLRRAGGAEQLDVLRLG
ncbi:MAG TPA: hypothetical protein VHX62_17760 [Solirubrobacteraceae bacterium]|jgi:hypothetical protein|nr:hypothetical protein [Solirubrobacteraceae bacterium]